jgi:hypothetical protein
MINTNSDDWRAVEAHLTDLLETARRDLETAKVERAVIELQERIKLLRKLLAFPSVRTPELVPPLGFEN